MSMILAAVSTATLLRMGQMAVEPKIDNDITLAEANAASGWYGPISTETGLMCCRYGVAYVGWTKQGIYFATRTSIPDAPQQLNGKDTVSIVLLPPGATQPKTFAFALKGEARVFPTVTRCGVPCCELEKLVTWEDLGVAAPTAKERWGLDMRVSFSSKAEEGRWHWNKDAADELGTLVLDPAAPVPSLASFGPWESFRSTAWYKLRFRFANGTDRDVRLTSRSMAHTGVGFAKLDSNPDEAAEFKHKEMNDMHGKVVKAGEVGEFRHEDVPLWMGTVNIADMDIYGNDEPLIRRRLAWDLGRGAQWQDDVCGPMIRTAFFPSDHNRFRCFYATRRVRDVVKASIRVVGRTDGKVYFEKTFGRLDGNGLIDTHLEGLPEQDYSVCFACTGKDGRTYDHTRSFRVKTFPWQNTAIGEDRIIVPPFKPIRVDGDRTSFLLTGYRCGDNVLWDEIYAEGENILADPVALRLNGGAFDVESAKIIEKADDRVVREIDAVHETLPIRLRTTHIYDYDGFCEVRFRFIAEKPVKVDALTVSIPLRNELARFFQVQIRDDVRAGQTPDFSLKPGEGKVWDSMMNVRPNAYDGDVIGTIQPFIWYGDVAKGVSTLLTTTRNMSLTKDRPTQRIIRTGGAAVLEQDFVNVATEWTGEAEYVMYFEPTPVKPRNWATFQYVDHMYGYAHPTNGVGCSEKFMKHWVDAPIRGSYNVLPDGSRELIDYCFSTGNTPAQKEFYVRLEEFISKHADWFANNPLGMTATAFREYHTVDWRITGVPVLMCYYNPLLVSCFWPEWEMYKSDWYVEAWPNDNLYNEYMGRMSKTYLDKFLWEMRNTARMGAKGFFFDCYCLQRTQNFAAGRAYFDEKGVLQRELGTILEWRELTRRTATMLTKEGILVNGVPQVEVHASDGIMPMVCAFASTVMNQERGGRLARQEGWPKAFTESWTLADSTGLQSGVGVRPIIKTSQDPENLRAVMAYGCAYGIFNFVDQGTLYTPWFEKAWNIVFDFGWGKPEVTPHWYYVGKQPVVHTGKGVRLTVAEKKDAALLMFGNIAEETETFTFDVSGLGFGAVRITDAETGDVLEKPELTMGRYSYRLIRVERK